MRIILQLLHDGYFRGSMNLKYLLQQILERRIHILVGSCYSFINWGALIKSKGLFQRFSRYFI